MPVRWASQLRNARDQSPPGAETGRAGAIGDKLLGQRRAPLSGSHLLCRWAFERHPFWPCGTLKAGEGSLGRPSTTLLGRFRAGMCREAPEPLLQCLHPLLGVTRPILRDPPPSPGILRPAIEHLSRPRVTEDRHRRPPVPATAQIQPQDPAPQPPAPSHAPHGFHRAVPALARRVALQRPTLQGSCRIQPPVLAHPDPGVLHRPVPDLVLRRRRRQHLQHEIRCLAFLPDPATRGGSLCDRRRTPPARPAAGSPCWCHARSTPPAALPRERPCAGGSASAAPPWPARPRPRARRSGGPAPFRILDGFRLLIRRYRGSGVRGGKLLRDGGSGRHVGRESVRGTFSSSLPRPRCVQRPRAWRLGILDAGSPGKAAGRCAHWILKTGLNGESHALHARRMGVASALRAQAG